MAAGFWGISCGSKEVVRSDGHACELALFSLLPIIVAKMKVRCTCHVWQASCGIAATLSFTSLPKLTLNMKQCGGDVSAYLLAVAPILELVYDSLAAFELQAVDLDHWMKGTSLWD